MLGVKSCRVHHSYGMKPMGGKVVRRVHALLPVVERAMYSVRSSRNLPGALAHPELKEPEVTTPSLPRINVGLAMCINVEPTSEVPAT